MVSLSLNKLRRGGRFLLQVRAANSERNNIACEKYFSRQIYDNLSRFFRRTFYIYKIILKIKVIRKYFYYV